MEALLKDKGLLVSLSIFSLAIGAHFLFKRTQPPHQGKATEEGEKLQKQESQISKQLERLNDLQAVLAKKAEEIDLKYLKNAPHVLAPQCLQQIFEFTPTIVDPQEVESIFSNNRKARRSCFRGVKQKLGGGPCSQLEMYYRFVCTFEEQVQYIIEKAQKDFVIFLNIDYSVITDSIDFLLTDQALHTWIKSWSTQVKDQLKDSLSGSHPPASLEVITDVVNFQIQVLMQEEENFLKAVEDLHLESEEERMALPTFLEAFLEDLVFEKYQLEMEQLSLEPNELTPQLLEKLHILKQLKNSLVQAMRKGELQSHIDDEENDVSEGEGVDQELQQQEQ